ncbi:MAG: ABC transporter substrate-binding protein [Campylobacter sp.]
MKKMFLAFLFSCVFAVAAEPKKIVVLDPAVVEIMYMLKAENNIAAIATLEFAKIWPQDKTVNLKSVGTYSKPNLEKIVELKPDFTITSFHSQGVNADLQKFGIKTLSFKADSVNDIYSNIKAIANITNTNDEAQKIIEQIERKFDTFKDSKLKGKKILGVFSSTPLTAFNGKTLPGDIFEKLEMINVAKDLQGSTPIASTEFILAQNPDFIVVVGRGEDKENFLKQNPILKTTNAAKNDKIIVVPSSMILRGSPRIDESVERLYEMLIK